MLKQKQVKNSNRSKTSRNVVKSTLSPDYVAKIESKLSKHFGNNVKLHEKRGGAGQFIICFDNRIQMEDLINKLLK